MTLEEFKALNITPEDLVCVETNWLGMFTKSVGWIELGMHDHCNDPVLDVGSSSTKNRWADDRYDMKEVVSIKVIQKNFWSEE